MERRDWVGWQTTFGGGIGVKVGALGGEIDEEHEENEGANEEEADGPGWGELRGFVLIPRICHER